MLDRFTVTAEASRFIKPVSYPVTVEIVSVSQVSANQTASMAWIAKDHERCTANKGYPLEVGTKVEVDLMPGESLWAITQDIALLAFSVKGYRGA